MNSSKSKTDREERPRPAGIPAPTDPITSQKVTKETKTGGIAPSCPSLPSVKSDFLRPVPLNERSSSRQVWFLALILAGIWGLLAAWPGGFAWLGIRHFGTWFLDSAAILAANDAQAQGLDPYALNPLDPLTRPHVYSEWWLGLGRFGLTRDHNLWVGLGLGLAFTLAAVAWLRPRTRRELLWSLAFAASPSVLMAVERANNDLVVFLLLAPVVPCLLASSGLGSVVAVLCIAAATGLKYYPAVAALLLLAGPAAGLRWRVAGGVAVLALVASSVAPGYLRVRSFLLSVDGPLNFGALHGLERLGIHGLVPALTAAALMVVAWIWADPFRGWTIPGALRGRWLHLILGAALLCGCFFTSTNYAYRWVFALWTTPWLWWAVRGADVPIIVRRLSGITLGLLTMALWLDPLVMGALTQWFAPLPVPVVERWANLIYTCEQPLLWALAACLLAFVTEFVRQNLFATKSG